MIQRVKYGKNILPELLNNILKTYLKLGGQSRITYAVAIFARFMKNIVSVTNVTKKC